MSRYNVPRDQSICIKNGQQLNQNQFFMFNSLLMLLGLIVQDVKFLTRHSLLSLFLLCLFLVSYSLKRCTVWIWEFAWEVWGGAKLQDKGGGVCHQCMYYQTKLLALQYSKSWLVLKVTDVLIACDHQVKAELSLRAVSRNTCYSWGHLMLTMDDQSGKLRKTL